MKKTARIQNFYAAAVIGALTLTPALFAQKVQPTGARPAELTLNEGTRNIDLPAKDPWQFDVYILGWVPSISGDVTVKGTKADVDVSASTLVGDLRGAAELGFEFRRSKYGFYVQPNWFSLEADAKTGGVSGNDKLTLWLVDAGGFYQLAQWGEAKPLSLNAVAGVRYWNLENEITLKDPTGATLLDNSTSLDLTDPVIGLHAQLYLTRKLDLRLHGDVGGFGLSGSTSDFAWQAIGSLGYAMTENWSLSLGYRALSVDKHSGRGADEHGAHLNFHGVMAGLEYHW